MPFIDKITIALTTYDPMRLFSSQAHWEANSDDKKFFYQREYETYISGWLRSINRLNIADEILIIEKAEDDKIEGPRHILKNAVGELDSKYYIVEAPNDPPYADPFRQRMLDEAKNDWVLILDDDERLSDGMIHLIDSLATQDPAPGKPWVAIRFPREDYIWYERLWRYVPANGLDHQMRLVNRRHVRWGDKPHSVPEVDGTILTVGNQTNSILHYRSFDKIVKWTENCNKMFFDMPHIVKMQNDYVIRLQQMLGMA